MAAVIAVHIGGYVAPSVVDLVALCDAVGVPLVDHVILTPEGPYASLLDLGVLAPV